VLHRLQPHDCLAGWVDANQAWCWVLVAELLATLAALGVELLQQSLRRSDGAGIPAGAALPPSLALWG
jgi:hypothetical protein